jgi:hypothetical protein
MHTVLTLRPDNTLVERAKGRNSFQVLSFANHQLVGKRQDLTLRCFDPKVLASEHGGDEFCFHGFVL